MTKTWTGAGYFDVSADTDFTNSIRFLSAASYGVVGNGTTDDTAAVQSALTAGATQNKVVYFGSMVVKLTGAVTMSGPGFLFDYASYGHSGDAGFKVTGSGYTALTINGSPTVVHGTVYGGGTAVNAGSFTVGKVYIILTPGTTTFTSIGAANNNAGTAFIATGGGSGSGTAMLVPECNGVLFQNPLLAQVQKLRVYALSGYGIKINKCWDCTFHDMSTEVCGSTAEYAFSMNDDGDTCNMTHVGRLQAETANRKAIYISPLALSCVFDCIHSEGLINADGATFAYILGGNSCQYNGMRIAGGVGTKLRLESCHCTYTAARIEASVDTELEGWLSTGITLIAPLISVAHERASQGGKITIVGGLISTWTGNKGNRTVYNTTITTDS